MTKTFQQSKREIFHRIGQIFGFPPGKNEAEFSTISTWFSTDSGSDTGFFALFRQKVVENPGEKSANTAGFPQAVENLVEKPPGL